MAGERMVRRGLATAVVAVAMVAGAVAAQDFDAVEIETVDLGDGLAMLVGRGGNVGLSAGADGALLIDDQFAPLSGKLAAAAEAFGGKPIRFVLNTHHHGDHAGGNEPLARAGAVVAAHDNVRRRLSTPQHDSLQGRTTPPVARAAWPVVTWSDGVAFHWNGHTIRTHHVPNAHTDGDSIVHVEDAGVLHMGDTYFAGQYPYMDLDAGGSIDGMIAAAARGLALADETTRIIPGHGPLSDRAELAAYRDMLVRVRAAVAALIEAGRSEDEAVAARPTRELDGDWERGFMTGESMTRLVYRSLARTRRAEGAAQAP